MSVFRRLLFCLPIYLALGWTVMDVKAQPPDTQFEPSALPPAFTPATAGQPTSATPTEALAPPERRVLPNPEKFETARTVHSTTFGYDRNGARRQDSTFVQGYRTVFRSQRGFGRDGLPAGIRADRRVAFVAQGGKDQAQAKGCRTTQKRNNA